MSTLSGAAQPDGRSWSTAYRDISAAITRGEELTGIQGCSSVEVWVAEGTYYPGTPPDRARSFALKSKVAVYGGFAGTEASLSQRDPAAHVTILSGDLNRDDSSQTATFSDNAYHVVVGEGLDSTAVLDGFTIRGGNADGLFPASNGAGLFLRDSSPVLQNLTIETNRARDGAGIYVERGVPRLTSVKILQNRADRGAGIFCSNSDAVLSEVTVQGNFAELEGAGMYNDHCDPQIDAATFNNNDAISSVTGSRRGAAMFNLASAPVVKNSNFGYNSCRTTSSNTSPPQGGAVFNDASNATFENCVFEYNTAASSGRAYGGAVFVGTGSSVIVSKTTFTNNSASAPTAYGGAIAAQGGRLTLVSSTLSSNRASDLALSRAYGGAIYSESAELSIHNSVITQNSSLVSSSPTSNDGAVVYSTQASFSQQPSSLSIVNTNIFGNSPGGVQATSGSTNLPVIANSIIWSNRRLGTGEQITGTVNLSYSCVEAGGFDESNPNETNRDDCDSVVVPAPGTPKRNRGSNAALPADIADLDKDGDRVEPLPLDVDGNPRIVEGTVDIGAKEGP